MPYFDEHYQDVRFPIALGNQPGLRRSQRGAAFAIASHFTLRSDPAVVVMPTGAGKTAILMMTPCLLQARRALVVTPSRLVRSQIVSNFRSLKTLREAKVFPAALPNPRVYEVDAKLVDVSAWEKLEQFDVVVGIPSSTSPAIEGIAHPPVDLFDLLLIDEAHHSPARTWNELLEAFPEARRVLFTATPFRSDQREIKGHFVYAYPVAEAFKDGVFGQIGYLPVTPDPDSDISTDVAIAVEVERAFKEDRAAGYKHFLMVRTNTRSGQPSWRRSTRPIQGSSYAPSTAVTPTGRYKARSNSWRTKS